MAKEDETAEMEVLTLTMNRSQWRSVRMALMMMEHRTVEQDGVFELVKLLLQQKKQGKDGDR